MSTLGSRINTLLLMITMLIGLAIVGMLATGVRGGPLDPPAAPAPTDSVREPGTPISAIPFTISAPGRYYVTRDLTGVVSQSGVTIASDNVTLDLHGFTLHGVASTGNGVQVSGARTGITITGGTVRNWYNGIDVQTAKYVHISNVMALDNGSVAGDGSYGIIVANGSTLENCTVSHNKSSGVLAVESSVRQCTFNDNGRNGIEVGVLTTVDGCAANRNGASGVVVTSATVRGCMVLVNGEDGIRASNYTFLQNNRALENSGEDINFIGDGNYASENAIGRIALPEIAGPDLNVGVRNGWCSAVVAPSSVFPTAGQSEYNTHTGCP
jgi:hypothetical protein